MILDADTLDPAALFEADCCIVGAGPVGISLALALTAAGLDIVVLESGGRRPSPKSQELCHGHVVNPALHSPAHSFRRRGLGGTSTIWGGRCAPFDPIDFAARDWLDLRGGWPIPYRDLLPYWQRASLACELGAFDYDAGTAVAGGMRPMLAGFANPAISTDRIERFSRPTDFGTAFAASLERSHKIKVLLHANCTSIALAESTRHVEYLEIATSAHRPLRVRARAYVLAAGGLETPRLLLASRDRSEPGIGNGHDQVGRHYMCHIAGTTGVFRPAAKQRVWHGYDRAAGGVYCRRRFSVEAWAQRAHGIGNAVARLHHPRAHDAGHRTGALSAIYLARAALPVEYATRLADPTRSGGRWAHLANIAGNPVDTAIFLAHALFMRRLARRKYPSVIVTPRNRAFTLDVHAEQLPNPSSRITLGLERDANGTPNLCIDWRRQQADIRTVQQTLLLLAQALTEGGHGTLSFDPDEVEADMLRDGAYGGHHIGTARMSASPRTGVVDANCRVHGVENLYIAGSAVFATSSQANPTFTAIALALRLADHLQAELAVRHPSSMSLPSPANEPAGTLA